MKVGQIVRESFSLLDRRNQWLLGLITLAQMATAFLDLIGVLLLGAVSVLSVAVVTGEPLPGFALSAIERFGFTEGDELTWVAAMCIAAGVALIAKTLISALLARRTLRFLANRQAALSGRLTAGLLSRPLLEVQAMASQDVAFILTLGTQAATVGVLGGASAAIADVSLLVVLGLGLFVIDPVVTVFAILFFGLLAFGLQRLLSGWARRMGHDATFVDIDSYMAIQEALASYREVTVSNRRGVYVDRIQRLRWRSAALSADTQFMGLIPKYVFEVALVVGALGLAVSQLASKDAAAAVGIVAVFLVAGSRVMPAVMRLQTAALSILRSEAPAGKAYRLAQQLAAAPAPPDSPVRVDEIRRSLESGYPGFVPVVEVRGVGLTYDGVGAPAVAEVSFTAREGASVALVGSTGAGKSTIADILLGVVEPDEGSVTIGGVAPSTAVSQWPGGIAYVPQEVALANGTVRDNVALGLPQGSFDDTWVWEALERAHLADFLRDSREGLETLIGENGMRLSGGQRQRLGVARALFTHPRLLVLDEATSALDAETEQSIAQTMQDLEGNVTTVTIAHRLATVRHCDLVLYLEDGRVVAQGSFEEVRRQSPAFDHQAQLLGL
ncbi:MAG: ABC transporter ATP-binding protein [Actinomycetota bacterium]|nr:ABC transporter ATP-binding protein [Actinomycetota bacterium]